MLLLHEMDLKSNFDFEQNERLMAFFAETGHGVSTDIAAFVSALNTARVEAESVAERVGVKTELLKQRKDEVEKKMSQFQNLSHKVGLLNESLLSFKRPDGEILTDGDRAQLATRLAELEIQIQSSVDEAQALKKSDKLPK